MGSPQLWSWVKRALRAMCRLNAQSGFAQFTRAQLQFKGSKPEYVSGFCWDGQDALLIEAKMNAFPAGSFAYLDPDMHHYAMATGGEVIVQVHGMSPVQFNYVNASDDPSKK